MHITFFEIQGWEKPMIKKALKVHSLKFIKEPLTKENIKLAKNSDIISRGICIFASRLLFMFGIMPPP